MLAVKNSKINWWKIIFAIFVAAYALIMLISPRLGPTDDVVLLRTLQAGKPLLYYSPENLPYGYGDVTKLGRFAILGSMEYNLPLLFLKSPSPFWYYLIHAVQYVLLMVLFVKITARFTSNKFLIYITPVLLSLTSAVTIPFFRTHMMERNMIFYYAIFIYFFLRYLEKPKLYYLIFGIISANMAIHNKEIGFIALGSFAFFHLLLSWKKSKLGLKIFDGLALLSCLAYLLLYYFIVLTNLPHNPVIYGQTPYNALMVIIKNLLNYGLFTDPVIVLILLPFTAWRIYKVSRKQLELHPVYDSMLIAALMYVLAFFALKIYGPYYLLPAYIFALPPIFYFLSREKQRIPFLKSAIILCALILALNTFPSGIHYLTFYKYLSLNFNKTMDFLVSDVNSRYPDKRADIFIDALDYRAGASIPYFIFSEFLQYKGLTSNRFDFKSSVKIEDTDAWFRNIKKFNPPFTVFQNNNFSKEKGGDYLIVPAEASTKNISKDYVQSLSREYDLIFRTKSPLAFPNFNFKTLIKYFLSKKISLSQKEKGVMINENLMQWPNYYVFIRK